MKEFDRSWIGSRFPSVQAVVDALRERHGGEVENRVVREEHVSFPLPRELRVLSS